MGQNTKNKMQTWTYNQNRRAQSKEIEFWKWSILTKYVASLLFKETVSLYLILITSNRITGTYGHLNEYLEIQSVSLGHPMVVFTYMVI